MFSSLSRRATALAASSLVVATAAMLAAVQGGQGPVPAQDARTAAGAAAPAPAPDGAAVHPRPGSVAVCDEPGTDEIVRVPDPAAPEEGRPIWVRRPPGPDSADLPVLYLLHGSTGTHTDLKDAGIGPAMDEQMCRAGIEFVIAAPFGQEAGGADTEWGDAVDDDYRIETFVTRKAVEAVEGDLRRPRELRAIGGFSMGGYGAAALPLRHPDLYSQAVSWAGYFKVDDPSGTFGDRAEEHAPDRLLDDPEVQDIRFMLVEGEQDRTPLQEGSIHGEAERFSGLLEERGMAVETLFPEGGHTYDAWLPTFPQAVDFLTEGWAGRAAPAPGD
ncbi:alpha/beta hydrolase [Nocardiopsis chromatogenes]|uniref:alpha/beta hydrolase n=1 Tax=Nocardiopsis chromatogenes TaxID=280239 RepID=UPI00034A6E00|nr:alpha/beta hydrolase-fold protein [Nocardiopsis chromatogenes]